MRSRCKNKYADPACTHVRINKTSHYTTRCNVPINPEDCALRTSVGSVLILFPHQLLIKENCLPTIFKMENNSKDMLHMSKSKQINQILRQLSKPEWNAWFYHSLKKNNGTNLNTSHFLTLSRTLCLAHS